jgi:hypothetical protein
MDTGVWGCFSLWLGGQRALPGLGVHVVEQLAGLVVCSLERVVAATRPGVWPLDLHTAAVLSAPAMVVHSTLRLGAGHTRCSLLMFTNA